MGAKITLIYIVIFIWWCFWYEMKEEVEKILSEKIEDGEHISPVLPEGIKNYLIDIEEKSAQKKIKSIVNNTNILRRKNNEKRGI